MSELFIGVKVVKATPMDYNDAIEKGYRVGDKTATNGYEVEYEDGYKSWSPKDVFEKAYRKTSGMTFGLAVEAMKMGKKVARSGWNGSGMFAVLSPGKKQLSAEDFFNKDLKEHAQKIGGSMDVRPAFMLKTAQNDVAYWSPSGSDCLAEDWFIVE